MSAEPIAVNGEIAPPTGRAFRMAGKYFLLTYPQCVLSKARALEILLELYSDIERAVVAFETHADGSPHLHIWCQFKTTKNFTSPFTFDLVDLVNAGMATAYSRQNHGNYQVCRSPKKCLEYAMKDGDVLVHPSDWDPKEFVGKNAKKGTATVVAEGLRDGDMTFADVAAQFPAFAMVQNRKIREWEAEWSRLRRFKELPGPLALVSHIRAAMESTDLKSAVDLNVGSASIVEWLLMNFGSSRRFRQKQLYLWGPPGIGKSRLIGRLRTFVALYEVPRNIDYYDLYQDGAYHGAFLDEFKGQKTVQFLNTFLDGNVFTMNKKGHYVEKTDNLPVIVCSNLELRTVYSLKCQKGEVDNAEVDSLCDRFIQVHVTEEDMLVVDSLFIAE